MERSGDKWKLDRFTDLIELRLKPSWSFFRVSFSSWSQTAYKVNVNISTVNI